MTNNLQSYLTIWERENAKDDIAILKQRLLIVTPENENYPMNITHLFPTNASVDAHKNALYTLSKTDNAKIKAVDIIIGDTSDDHKRQKSQIIQQRQWTSIHKYQWQLSQNMT